jgi:hypothetical protein
MLVQAAQQMVLARSRLPDLAGGQLDPFAVALAGHHAAERGPLGGEGLV